MVNFLDAYLGDWFASERTERLTLDYATHEFEGRVLRAGGAVTSKPINSPPDYG